MWTNGSNVKILHWRFIIVHNKLLKYWKNFTLKCKSLIYKVNDVFDQIAQPKYTCTYVAMPNIISRHPPILGILIKGGRIACIV